MRRAQSGTRPWGLNLGLEARPTFRSLARCQAQNKVGDRDVCAELSREREFKEKAARRLDHHR
eukprot:1797861-Pyramimonas_sp.AAC.1